MGMCVECRAVSRSAGQGDEVGGEVKSQKELWVGGGRRLIKRKQQPPRLVGTGGSEPRYPPAEAGVAARGESWGAGRGPGNTQ